MISMLTYSGMILRQTLSEQLIYSSNVTCPGVRIKMWANAMALLNWVVADWFCRATQMHRDLSDNDDDERTRD